MQKKFVLGLTSLVVASAVAIGGTLAFMTAKTDEKVNTFTAIGSNVSGLIKETTWDNSIFTGDAPSTIPTENLGVTKAGAMTPNMTIPKDPMLKNTSPIAVYMAIKVTYSSRAAFTSTPAVAATKTTAAIPEIPALATLRDANGNEGVNSGWVKYASVGLSDYYVYATNASSLTSVGTTSTTNKTAALFNSVKINADATNSQIVSHNFSITVKGAAVQTSDITIDQAKTQLTNALDAA